MAVIFYPPRNTGGGGGGAATWGSITGTLSAQTDLQTALNGKAALLHAHSASDITSGTLDVARGGTGISTAATNGQILIGNGSGFALSSITAGSGISVTPGVGTITIAATGTGITGFTASENTSSPNDTVNASRLLVSAASVNADFVIQSKGTGAILAQLSDNTTSGGNKRGTNAVDFQMFRTNANQVASGMRSAIIGGQNNSVSGENSGIFGSATSTVSGIGSVVLGGTLNTVNTDSSAVVGGSINVIDSAFCAILGGYGNTIGGPSNQYTTILGGAGLNLTGVASFGFNGNNSGLVRGMTVSASRTGIFNNVDLWITNNDNTPRTLRFYEQYNLAGNFPNGSNYVGFRAPNTIAADVLWTLPNADGTNGQVLQTNGTGTLSWVTAGGAWGSIAGTLSDQTDLQTALNAKADTSALSNYLLKSSNLSDVANVVTARSNLGLGSLATLSSVGTSQLANLAVTDAKINDVAATKITGTIATAQIANSAVTDAKISAVATSKLTGTIATAQIADTAVTDAKISAVAASKLTGAIAPARLNLSTSLTIPYNNAGTIAESNVQIDSGRSLWIAKDDLAAFLKIGSNAAPFLDLNNSGTQLIRTGTGQTLFINDNSNATTTIGSGTGIVNIGNSTAATNLYGSTLIIAGTNNRINVGSDATGDILYRNSSGNLARLGIGSTGQVLTVASGLPSWAAAGGGVTGFTGSQNTSSPNNTVNVSQLLVTASSTNADFAITPKGTGAILAQLPDSTATGGNKRGEYAVDLQMLRSSASQVASGANSFVAGGNNTASGTNSVAVGSSNTASGTASVATGVSGTASGDYSTIAGRFGLASGYSSFGVGVQCYATGRGSMALGNYGKAYIDGQVAMGANGYMMGGSGGAQTSVVTLASVTTDATPVVLNAEYYNTTSTSYAAVENNKAIHFIVKIIARNSSTGDVATFMRDGVIKNTSGTTALVGTIGTIGTDRSDVSMSSCVIAITADNTNDRLQVEVTGIAATTIRWVCSLIYTETV